MFEQMRHMPIRFLFFVCFVVLLFPSVLASTYIDSDGEIMYVTGEGFDIRVEHPRVSVPSKQYLNEVISRMYGSSSRDPYEKWFNKLQQLADSGESVSDTNLALLYLATNNQSYKNKVLENLRTSSGSYNSLSELYAIDLLFDEIPNSTKLHLLRRADQNEFHYNSLNVAKGLASESWGYHAFHEKAVIFSSIFAYTEILDHENITNNPLDYEFDVNNYLKIAFEAVAPGGKLWMYERAVGGDMSLRDGLQGSYGGMYDNFGYDQSEEKNSIYTISALSFLTKESLYEDFLRDKYKGEFYQFMYYPHTRTQQVGNSYCRPDGSYSQTMAMIWNTQSSTYTPQPSPQTVALRAFVFNDPHMQYFSDYGRDIFQCGDSTIKESMFYDLLYYDDSITPSFPNENPTSRYFSGPGFVSTRSNWDDSNSLFSVFISGDAISRRYTDANSFLLSRNSHLIVHAGARFRSQEDNFRHFWLTQRSAAKNTLKIFDPNECLDRNYSNYGYAGTLCSGPQLFDSENLGGQMFEIGKADNNLEYPTYSSMPASTPHNPYGIQNYDMGEIKKYEFVEGDYSYSQGDATKAYTKKIDFFEREFVFLYPNKVVIFDRVKSTSPNFEKRWTIHTVPEPQVEGVLVNQDLGYRSFENASRTIFQNDVDKMVIDSLYPKNSTIHVRGGKEVHLQDVSLSQGETLADISLEMDIPRWVEILVSGDDLEGTITITGDAKQGNGVSEEIVFDGTPKNYFSSRPSSISSNSLYDSSQNWEIDQWKGYMVKTRGPTNYAIITGNSENTLYVDNFNELGSPWRYEIYKGVSNSFYHWKRIDSITSNSVDISNLQVQTPHEFDTEDVNGNVYSFSPHTYGPDSSLMRREPGFLGRWTFETQATIPKDLDNFFNIITVDNPGATVSKRTVLEGENVLGSIIDDSIVVFSRDKENLTTFTLPLTGSGTYDVYFFNLEPETNYEYDLIGGELTVSKTSQAGDFTSSTMGVGKILSLDLSNPPVIDFSSSKTSISYRELFNLSWDVVGANSCEGSGDWSGEKPLRGSQEISIIFNSTYFLNCSNENGNSIVNVSISISNQIKPSISSIEGVLSNSEVISVSGNNFGQKEQAEPVLWLFGEDIRENGVKIDNYSYEYNEKVANYNPDIWKHVDERVVFDNLTRYEGLGYSFYITNDGTLRTPSAFGGEDTPYSDSIYLSARIKPVGDIKRYREMGYSNLQGEFQTGNTPYDLGERIIITSGESSTTGKIVDVNTSQQVFSFEMVSSPNYYPNATVTGVESGATLEFNRDYFYGTKGSSKYFRMWSDGRDGMYSTLAIGNRLVTGYRDGDNNWDIIKPITQEGNEDTGYGVADLSSKTNWRLLQNFISQKGTIMFNYYDVDNEDRRYLLDIDVGEDKKFYDMSPTISQIGIDAAGGLQDVNSALYLNEIYFDSSFQRIMISNYSRFNQTGNELELQYPLTWSDSEIQFELRLGALDINDDLYLYVFNKDDLVNEQGYLLDLQTQSNDDEDTDSSEQDDSTSQSSGSSGGSGSSGSSSGGGGSSSSSSNSDSADQGSRGVGASESGVSSYVAPSCQSDFSYSAWSSCVGGTQFRIVSDQNSCVDATRETRICREGIGENELRELNAKEVVFLKINEKRYQTTFSDSYNEMVYTTEKLADERFVVVDAVTNQQYLGTLVDQKQGKYYYALERVDQNNVNKLKEQGLAQRSLSESVTSAYQNFKNSQNFVSMLVILSLFGITTIIYLISRYMKRIHKTQLFE